MADEVCFIDGNSDLGGFGIRCVKAFVMLQLMLACLLVVNLRPLLLGIVRGYLATINDTELQILEKRMKDSHSGANWHTGLGIVIALLQRLVQVQIRSAEVLQGICFPCHKY